MCITNYIYESIHILTILNIECIELTTVGMLGIHYPEPLHVERIGNPAPKLDHFACPTSEERICQFPVSVS